MTKKHFEAIAQTLLRNKGAMFEEAHQALCEDLADYFERENPRFDRVRFMKACGME